MRLGIHTGYWSAGPPDGIQDAVVAADRLGVDSVWTAEAYGSDAFTVHTESTPRRSAATIASSMPSGGPADQ